ncbi:MAG: CpXC domain-containing protein [Candidatus Thorarchaeota archaeon]|jgi:phage FluMu protein Com
MAGTSVAEIKCVKCKKVYESDVIDHIDLSQDRDLAKNLKAGKANRVQCPKCKKVQFLNRSIVINFEPENLIVVFDPAARKKSVREDHELDYQTVISFNEILEEVGEETQFKVISKLDQLKTLVADYMKAHE